MSTEEAAAVMKTDGFIWFGFTVSGDSILVYGPCALHSNKPTQTKLQATAGESVEFFHLLPTA